MGQKQKRIRQKERQDQAEENKREDIEKWDQTDSPEMPDRGETSESPAACRQQLGTAMMKMDADMMMNEDG